jgi:hypothetical protein
MGEATAIEAVRLIRGVDWALLARFLTPQEWVVIAGLLWYGWLFVGDDE